MITLRQNCARCEVTILYDHVNKESGVYNCQECNTVGSIYDDKEYKAPNEITAPESVKTQFLTDKMYIDIKGHNSVPVRGPLAYAILACLAMLIISGLSRCFSSGIGTNTIDSIPFIVGLCILLSILFVISYFRMKNRIIRIEVGPKFIKINQIINGEPFAKSEFEEGSFMISQIYVREEEREEKDDKGNVQRKYKIYFLKALLKDMTERTILPEMLTKETYLYIEYLIEDYLGIKNRKISSEL